MTVLLLGTLLFSSLVPFLSFFRYRSVRNLVPGHTTACFQD
jgi:hypothetical protein